MLDYIYKLSEVFEDLIEESSEEFQPEIITISAGWQGITRGSSQPGPTWISDDKLAKFADFKPIAKLVATRPVNLILVNSSKDMENLVKYLDADDFDVKSLSETVCNAGYDGWQIPRNNCLDGHNILICNPEDCFEIEAKL